MNSKIIIITLLVVVSFRYVLAGDAPMVKSVVFLSTVQDSLDERPVSIQTLNADEAASRRNTALFYSIVMPGSGQTMLGNPYKGVAITLTAFGSLLTTVISHNNFIARGERLDALEFQYANATSWVSANVIYDGMISTHQQLKRDKNRRDIFLIVTAAIWAINIVDVLYNTDDQGQTLFSTNGQSEYLLPKEIAHSPHSPLLSFSIPIK